MCRILAVFQGKSSKVYQPSIKSNQKYIKLEKRRKKKKEKKNLPIKSNQKFIKLEKRRKKRKEKKKNLPIKDLVSNLSFHP